MKSCLQLKVGAQVMLLQSLKGKTGLVNGSRGRVIHFAGTTNPVPVVRFTDVSPMLLARLSACSRRPMNPSGHEQAS